MESQWNLTQTLSDHKGPVHCAVFSSGSGGYLITGAQDRAVRLWNPKTGTLVKTYAGHGYEVLGVAPSHDNTRIASCGGDRSVFYWDVATGQPIKRFSGHASRINAVAFNGESTVLASGSFDSSVRLWDLKSQQRLPIQILEQARDSVTSIIVTNHDIITGSVDGHVRWYDLRAGQLFDDYYENPVTSVSLTKDKQTILISTLDSTIRLMDVNNGSLLQTYKGHKNTSYRIKACLNSKETNVITGDEDGNLWTYDLVEGHRVGKQSTESGGKSILWTAHHPSVAEQMIATADGAGAVKVWQRGSQA